MERLFAKYMKSWKRVRNPKANVTYKLIADMDEQEDTVKAVQMDSWRRYELLTAWCRNWDNDTQGFRDRFTENIESCREERLSYEKEIRIEDVFPDNEVSFVNLDGTTKMTVKDLTVIRVNGIRALVVYDDDYHFHFGTGIAMNLYGGTFHKHQFAEICDRHSVKMELIDPKENTVTVYSKHLNADGYGDFIRCTDCGKLQLVRMGTIQCSACKSKDLAWCDEDHQECDVDELVRQGYTIHHT